MEESSSKLPRLLILQLLELIDQCENNITHLFETGSNEKSFAVKQEKYLLTKYCKELNEVAAKNYKEVELTVVTKKAKAA